MCRIGTYRQCVYFWPALAFQNESIHVDKFEVLVSCFISTIQFGNLLLFGLVVLLRIGFDSASCIVCRLLGGCKPLMIWNSDH